MNTPNQPNVPEQGDGEVEATFDELASSIPEPSALTPNEVGHGLEDVVTTMLDPMYAGRPLHLDVQLPAGSAPALRAEASQNRIAAMVQAITASASLTMSPPQT